MAFETPPYLDKVYYSHYWHRKQVDLSREPKGGEILTTQKGSKTIAAETTEDGIKSLHFV